MSLPSQAPSPPQPPGRSGRARARGGDRRRQHAGDAQDRAVQRQLAERQVALGRIRGHGTHADQQRQRDRQIEVAALLGEIGGREIDRDALGRQAEAERARRCARSATALSGRPTMVKAGGGADLHLDVDVLDVDPGERDGAHPGHAERRGTVDRHRGS